MNTPNRQPVSIIVPTLNEVDNLAPLLIRIKASMTKANIPYEVIIIDDHSTDGTPELARKVDSEYHVRVFTKQGKPGKAFSLLEGFEVAEHNILCMIDGDLQYPPEEIVAMYHKMEYTDADVVLTERTSNDTSALRKLSTFTFNFIFTRVLFGINYDTQSGLKLFKKKVIRSITVMPSQWSFDLEFIVRSLENNFRIVSHRIAFAERTAGVAKVRMISAAPEMMAASVRLSRNTSKKHIKHNFKRLESLQQRSLGVVVMLAVILGISFISPNGASAATIEIQPVQHTQIITASLVTSLTDALGLTDTKSGSTIDTGTTTPAVTAPTTSAPVTNAAQPQTATAPAQTTPESAAPTTTTTRQATNLSSTTAYTENTANSATPNSSAAQVSTTQPGSSTKKSSSNYYGTGGLGATRAKHILNYAIIAVAIGAGMIVAGSAVAFGKRIKNSGRMHHQTQRA